MGTNCSTNCTCMQPNESNMKYLENPHAALTPIGSIDQDSLVTNESIVTTPNSRKVIEMRGNNRRESLEQQKRKHKEHSKHKKEKKREKRNSNGSIKTNASNASNASSSSSSSSSSSNSSASSNSSKTSSNSNGSNNDNNNNNNNNDIKDINSILNNNNNSNSSTSPISVISPLSVVSPINHNINNNVILPRIAGNINENEEMSIIDSDSTLKNNRKNVSVPLSARLSSPNNNNNDNDNINDNNNNKNRFFGQLRPINSSKQDRIRAQSLGGINDNDLAMVNSVESANMNSISNSKEHWRGNGHGNGHHHHHHRPRLGSYTGTHSNYVIKHISMNSSTDLDAQSVGLINKERANSVGLSPKPSLINQRNAQSFNITELMELEAPMKEQLKYLKKREKIYQKMISKTDGLDANTWHA